MCAVCREQKSVAIRLGFGCCRGTDVATCAGAVFYNKLLAEYLAEFGSDDARNRVIRAAGGLRNNHRYRAIRIGSFMKEVGFY